MSSLLKRAKHKIQLGSSRSDPSLLIGTSDDFDSDSKYQTTRDNLIGATKVVKAVAEVASFLGPLKSTCELVILFLEKTKAINESTEGLKALNSMLKSHIGTLEDSWHSLQEKQTDLYRLENKTLSRGLKNTLTKVDQALKEREKGAKGLFKKIESARIEPGALAAYRDEIIQHLKTFDEATVVCQVNIQAEARLGPEKPRPMGTQHDTCLKGTRELILQEIREWRRAKEVDKRIFWLCDIGGSGKSTVAYTMTQEWDEEPDILLGRFFFSRNARDTSDTDTFCSTLARDLASKHPELSSTITDALKVDSLLTVRDFTKQFKKLVSEPLRSISQDVVFVLDAVDECKLESRKRMLQVLLPEVDSHPTLKDKAIVRSIHFEMQGSKNQSNMADITSYVDHHLTSLLSRKDREQLVIQSNGLFIWVSTARFELELAADNPTQFRSTMNSLLSRGAGGDLQTLYLGILNRVLRGELKDLICRVLSILAILYEPVSIVELESVVKSMRSVFRVGDTIEFIHPTFREYLNDIEGKGTIPDAHISHTDLALSTLAALQQDLRRDICNIDVPELPFPDNKDIEDLNDRLSALWRQSPSLFYSSQYWALHVSQAIQDASVIQKLGLFLETKLLNLIELLSLMGHLLRIQDVLGLRRKLELHWPNNEAIELCDDTWRLVQSQQLLLQRSALHVYTSGLLFLPTRTILAKIYRRRAEGDLPDILCGFDTHWSHYQTLAGHSASVKCFSISPDGARIVSGSDYKAVRMWDATTGASIGNALDVDSILIYLASSSDGSHVIAVTGSGSLTRWYWSSGEVISIELKCNGHIKALVFSPDENRVIFCNYGWALRSCDVTTGELVNTLFEGKFDYNAILSSSSDRSQVIYVHDGSLYLWDAMMDERIGTASLSHCSVECLAFSPDGSRIALGCGNGTIQLWDVTTGLCFLTDWKAHRQKIHLLTFSPDGTRIASGSGDGTLKLWNSITYSSIGVLKGHVEWIWCLAFSVDGSRIVSESNDRTLRIWDGLTGTGIGRPLEGHTADITCASFLAGNTRIVSGSMDSTLRLWDVAAVVSVGAAQERHTQRVGVIVFSPDGTRVLSGSADNTWRLWDTETGAAIGVAWKGLTGITECAAFSPDGTRVVSTAWNSLRLWDVATGASIEKTWHSDFRVHQLVFSPDGTKFISCDSNHSMQLWDTAFNPIGKPVKASLGRDHDIITFKDNISFSIKFGAIFQFIFQISNEGIKEMKFLPPTEPRTRPADAEIIFRDPCLIMRDAPRHTFMLPAEWRVNAWAVYRAKIALGFDSGRVMIINFSKLK
ncbi:WD40 repeat-like protein [Serendipita vermifera]|nr:WD40 repeat-like protein [Serendipita vermifera]